jgi:hypothetical protein
MFEVVIVGAGLVGLMLGCESTLASQVLMSRLTPVSDSRRYK